MNNQDFFAKNDFSHEKRKFQVPDCILFNRHAICGPLTTYQMFVAHFYRDEKNRKKNYTNPGF